MHAYFEVHLMIVERGTRSYSPISFHLHTESKDNRVLVNGIYSWCWLAEISEQLICLSLFVRYESDISTSQASYKLLNDWKFTYEYIVAAGRNLFAYINVFPNLSWTDNIVSTRVLNMSFAIDIKDIYTLRFFCCTLILLSAGSAARI